MSIAHLNPQEVWKHFEALTRIPRPSKHEDQVRAYLVQFGKDLGLETLVDEIGNVIIRKPATPGMENRHGVILQGHMDMVPQKNNNVAHNFETDPIVPRIVDDWVYASGTTLGADNGMGLAAAMAVLASKDIAHGPVEALFTTDEETGMTGAQGLKPGVIQGDILLNLDSETEGEFYVGCAGGVDGAFEFTYTPEEAPQELQPFCLNVGGLKGGHSGMDIILERGNANKILTRVLLRPVEKCGVRVASIEGGNLRNAIPREAHAVVLVPAESVACFQERVAEMEGIIKKELNAVDPGLFITLTPCERPAKVMPACITLKFLRAVYGAWNGIYSMSQSMKGTVDTSSNLAIVEAKDGKAGVYCLIRSLTDTAKDDMAQSLACTFANAGATVTFSGAYPGWRPNNNSAILKVMETTYQNLFGKTPLIMAIHAGLECGILGATYPTWDMISFGPTLMSPHSPEERCHIPSVQKFWDFLVETLKNIPVK